MLLSFIFFISFVNWKHTTAFIINKNRRPFYVYSLRLKNNLKSIYSCYLRCAIFNLCVRKSTSDRLWFWKFSEIFHCLFETVPNVAVNHFCLCLLLQIAPVNCMMSHLLRLLIGSPSPHSPSDQYRVAVLSLNFHSYHFSLPISFQSWRNWKTVTLAHS